MVRLSRLWPSFGLFAATQSFLCFYGSIYGSGFLCKTLSAHFGSLAGLLPRLSDWIPMCRVTGVTTRKYKVLSPHHCKKRDLAHLKVWVQPFRLFYITLTVLCTDIVASSCNFSSEGLPFSRLAHYVDGRIRRNMTFTLHSSRISLTSR